MKTIWAALLAVFKRLHILSYQRLSVPQHEGKGENHNKTIPCDHDQPETNMPRAEQTALHAVLREIAAHEKQHHAAERNFWTHHIRAANYLYLITGVGALISTSGLVFVGLSLWIAKQAADDGRIAANAAQQSANIAKAGNRAWLGPIDGFLQDDIVANKPLSFVIRYQNSGREPAVDVKTHYNIKPYDILIIDNGRIQTLVERDDVCKAVSLQKGADVIWPNAPDGYSMIVSIKQEAVWPGVIGGTQVLFVELCFAYATASDPDNRVHHTAFCYFYRKGYSPGRKLTICDAGHHID